MGCTPPCRRRQKVVPPIQNFDGQAWELEHKVHGLATGALSSTSRPRGSSWVDALTRPGTRHSAFRDGPSSAERSAAWKAASPRGAGQGAASPRGGGQGAEPGAAGLRKAAAVAEPPRAPSGRPQSLPTLLAGAAAEAAARAQPPSSSPSSSPRRGPRSTGDAVQRLPSLPEDTYVSHKFQVMLIGPKARGIMRQITAKAQSEGPISPGPCSARSLASGFSLGSRRSQPRYASEEKLAYFRLEEGLSAVKFHPIESFDDSFPSLQCWQDLREWLLVFLVDDRNGLKDEVLPELQRRRHELNFIVQSLRNKFKVTTNVPLQAMMLRHCRKGGRLPEAAIEGSAGKGPAELLANFLTGLQEITISHTQEPLLRVIDFDDGEQLCASVAKKVREVLEWERWSTEELV